MSGDPTTRVAMWCGPRNISTALLRSWESRADTCVSDEPLYAHYLHVTQLDHPMAAEVLEAGEVDAERVIDSLLGAPPRPCEVWYQKHMAHHLLPATPRRWIARVRNAFLLREPRAMIASLARALGRTPRLEETGLPQQVELFEQLSAASSSPPVLLSEDVLRAPEPMLRALCAALELPFTPAMLSWDAGPRASDGVWASHWYANVWASTGFAPPNEERVPELSPELSALAERAQPLFEQLVARRLRAD
ncbi:MAG: branched chain amino acid aminotransferase [Planctomycetota bacterium]|nr:MAG: branched chain amino acid aminotransferase [Planctomycetota bacterium]